MTQDQPRIIRNSVRAFTLIEILLVLAILALLVGISVSKVGNILGGSNEDIARIFVQNSLKTPLTSYRIHMGTYPSTEEGLQALIAAPSGKEAHWRGPYVETTGGQLPLDPWKQEYVYRFPGTHNKDGYDVFSKGPDQLPDTEDDIGNW